jgi:predicted PurR-regulated permease PerM
MLSKLISKNNIGILSALILILFLVQARTFNFLIDSILGRTLTVLLILGITYANHILGVVAVLTIIIMFNQSEIGYLEGFTSDASGNANAQQIKTNLQQRKQNIQNQITQQQQDASNNTTNSTNSSSTTTQSFIGGREGFNILDKEHSMLKGKKSNEIPVSRDSNEADGIEPSDKNVFTSSYSSV